MKKLTYKQWVKLNAKRLKKVNNLIEKFYEKEN